MNQVIHSIIDRLFYVSVALITAMPEVLTMATQEVPTMGMQEVLPETAVMQTRVATAVPRIPLNVSPPSQ